jgi:repressor LexA
MIPVSKEFIKDNNKYFFLKAKGDSMDHAGIFDGDLVLVQSQTYANDGEIVVALIDEEATIKEIKYNNDSIVLKPNSTNPNHVPFVLTRDFQVQGVVVTSIQMSQIKKD